MNKHAVAYYRVSTDRQGKSGLNLEAQQTAVQNFSTAHSMQLDKEFTKIESGKKNNRPVLHEALAYCKKYTGEQRTGIICITNWIIMPFRYCTTD